MSVCTGPITQVAWVVPDIAAAEAHLTAVRGNRKRTRLPGIRFASLDGAGHGPTCRPWLLPFRGVATRT